ncbi:MAG: PhoU domain-containing protein [Candidatus Korarchaeota archaeon]|nr:hypothetical protein [Thermoproteota archaeon]MCR8462969.1 hypothetical protein [Thermoproteota archaeon]MCR8471287.1 hypothetical protein [Thermoproteota archaeon]MCR8472487.1 hypothetical protein [Thermoproteota archaeon]MCR8473790.1 hypothetical protein [Thermoproteota archaeon]
MMERVTLEAKMRKLEDMLLRMHVITKQSMEAIIGLPSNNAWETIRELEYTTDIINWELFEEAVMTIATQQPTARDLRFIIMVASIASIYERINDLALDIATCVGKIGKIPQELDKNLKTILDAILNMLEVTRKAMATHSFINLYDTLSKLDDVIDNNFREILDFIKNSKDLPAEVMLNLVMIFRDLERIGDLMGKIGSRLIYIETGKMIPIK